MKKTIIAVVAFVALAGVVGAQAYYTHEIGRRVDALSGQSTPGFGQWGPPTAPGAGPWTNDQWNPFAEMRRMQEQMNHMFSQAFSHGDWGPGFAAAARPGMMAPRVDVTEKGNAYVVKANIPGANATDINVSVDGRTLRLDARTHGSKEQRADAGHVVRQERFAGEFERTLTLPGPVDATGMHTAYKDGVLTVTVPKARA